MNILVRKETGGRRRTFADVVRDLGDIPLDHIRAHPAPGTATFADAVAAKQCEWIDRTLVEKAMELRESLLAEYLISVIADFVRSRNLGIVTGE